MNMAWLIVFFSLEFPCRTGLREGGRPFGATAFLRQVLYGPGFAMLEQVL